MSQQGACCPEGSLPALAFDYEPKGIQFEIAPTDKKKTPLQVYVVGASETDTCWNGPVLVMCSDIFGPFSGMHRKLADEFVSRLGGVAILPDPWEGTGGICPQYNNEDNKPHQIGFNMFTLKVFKAMVWDGKSTLRKYPWETSGRLLFTEQLIPFLQSKGINKFAMMGFCYGCWMIMKACNDPGIVEHVTCGIHFHPSTEMVERSVFGRDCIVLCETCAKPQMIHATKHESDNWKPNGAAHNALQKNEKVSDVEFSLAPFSQSHGFMTRADMTRKEDQDALKEGVDKAVAFLKKHNV
ncbi:dienelactone hydrolase family protein [Nitzschia inconspicua]|uniref:Dienelactone hydrolase family protein n=1 Tax=Nitzschia inconspicua TaxID=303405 RepID=A0A9K3PM74_9STRA|nr:dienelactone hydrolase family protein [Nitzschia inconspicua]